ncbi:MAG: VCBS repeat-containing protein, partial [Chloroflexi bacterium]
MSTSSAWDYMICANLPPETRELGSLAVGDIDGDGLPEMILGGNDGLFWFRPDTHAIGKIGPGHFHVGLVVEELDGRPTVVCGEATSAPGQPEAWGLTWYRPSSPDLSAPWQKGWIAGFPEGGPHDIVFYDLDGCGERELVTIACYTATPGVFAFKRGPDLNQPWQKIEILQEVFAEGLAVGDLDGDGLPEIVNGPDWFHMPPGGAFAGRWTRRAFAPNFREMCRTALVDITGSGRPDIVIADSEYMDGFLSWFENRLVEDPDHPWREHRLEEGLIYTHSLDVHRSATTRAPFPAAADGPNVHIFVAEMDAGGW